MSAAWAGTWHPVAERFPMLAEEELRRLADSITETGQLHPCLMTPVGTGLDGRQPRCGLQDHQAFRAAVGRNGRSSRSASLSPGTYSIGI